MVNGVLYFTAGAHRNAVAVNAATGEMLWMHRLEEGARAELSSRRHVGPRRRLLDRRPGRRADLLRHERLSARRPRREDRRAAAGLRHQRRRRSAARRTIRQLDLDDRATSAWNGAPVVARNVVIVGAAHRAGSAPRSKENAEGLHPRLRRAHRQAAVDLPHHSAAGRVRQRHLAERLVVLHRPHRRLDAADRRRRARHRLPADRDPDRRLLRRPSARQQPVRREPGRASKLETGKRLWHFQFVHHPIWDYDVPCAPILADITVDGQRDQGDRAADQAGLRSTSSIASTGQPVWPIEERPVEKGTLPTEMVFADAAVPDQAAAIRAPGLPRGLRHRLHAGAEGGSAEDRCRSTRSARCSRRRSRAAKAARSARSTFRTARTGRAARSIPRPGCSTSTRTRCCACCRW